MAIFQIFESDNKVFHLNIENALFLLLIIFGILFGYNYFLPITKYLFLLVMISGFILLFANMFRVKPIYGKLNGLLIFNSDTIQINEKIVSINDIAKLFIRMNDYEGKEYARIKPSFYPRLSNGTNNILRLELKNNEKIVIYFKVDLEYDYEKLRPIIINLIRIKLLSFEDGRKLIRVANAYEISKLEIEVNKKELSI